MKLRSFFSSQYFFEGVFLTLSLVLPALVLGQLGYPRHGLLMSFGALLTSLPDGPGARSHRLNAMIICCLIMVVTAFITGLIPDDIILLGTEITVFCFFFSMFALYGPRAGSIGSAALLTMVLTMGTHGFEVSLKTYCLLLLAGGIWYICLSTLISRFWPYRHLRQTLSECMHEVAEFLRVKASFYYDRLPEEQTYKEMIALQVRVNEKQETMRELLFRGRPPAEINDPALHRLLESFVQLVDLFEATMMMYHDYAMLRQQLKGTGILEAIGKQAETLANTLDRMSAAAQANKKFRLDTDFKAGIDELQSKIEALIKSGHPAATLPLGRIVRNLNDLARRLEKLQVTLFNKDSSHLFGKSTDYSAFILPADYSPRIFLDNLSFSSGIFRHSLRVASVCLAGFALSRFLYYGTHSYWILITILVILKPAFSQTKERNIQRIMGTVAGGVIGVIVLLIVRDKAALFAIMLILMIASFSFQRINYAINVLFMTPFVLIMIHIMGGGRLEIVWERILDTLIGCALAFPASYIILPSWESTNLTSHMQKVLKANYNYLFKLFEQLTGRPVSSSDYKLARKDAYVAAANLSSAYNRMLSEPRGKRRNTEQVYRFMVLNHILDANVASAASSRASGQVQPFDSKILDRAAMSLNHLQKASLAIGDGKELFPVQSEAQPGQEDIVLEQQLQFIERISADIRKLAEGLKEN